MSNFEHKRTFKANNSELGKYIRYKLTNLQEYTPPASIVKKSDTKYVKTLTTPVNVPKALLDLIGLSNITVDEHIEITENGYYSKIKAPTNVKKYLDFEETFSCELIDGQLNVTLVVKGKNKCPPGLKTLAENCYLKQRVQKINHEINLLGAEVNWAELDEDDIIQ